MTERSSISEIEGASLGVLPRTGAETVIGQSKTIGLVKEEKLRTRLLWQDPARAGQLRDGEGFGNDDNCERQVPVTYRWIRWALVDNQCFVKEEKLRTRLLWQDSLEWAGSTW